MRLLTMGMFIVAIALVISWCMRQQQERVVAAADGNSLPEAKVLRKRILLDLVAKGHISKAVAMEKLKASEHKEGQQFDVGHSEP